MSRKAWTSKVATAGIRVDEFDGNDDDDTSRCDNESDAAGG